MKSFALSINIKCYTKLNRSNIIFKGLLLLVHLQTLRLSLQTFLSVLQLLDLFLKQLSEELAQLVKGDLT